MTTPWTRPTTPDVIGNSTTAPVQTDDAADAAPTKHRATDNPNVPLRAPIPPHRATNTVPGPATTQRRVNLANSTAPRFSVNCAPNHLADHATHHQPHNLADCHPDGHHGHGDHPDH